MPCYHFNIHDDKDSLDEEGIDLPDLVTAQTEAIRLAGAMLLDEASLVHAQKGWSVSVVDPEGRTLLRVEVNVIDMAMLN